MQEDLACYCGLYCENCPVRAKVVPAAKVLLEEMRKAGFEDVIGMIPDGNTFWAFLKGMTDSKRFASCREGCGNPECAIRVCAEEKGIAMCALCESYPCGHFDKFLAENPKLGQDNALLRDQGRAEWAKLQDKRRAEGFTYHEWRDPD